MVRTEIQIAGFGGQGIVMAGLILGEAAVLDGKNAVQTQSYGPESRGGAARSDVIISDDEIDYPKVLKADILVAMSQPALDRYVSGAAADTVVVIDRDLVGSEDKSHRRVPFTRIADDLGKKIVANSVMLGYLAAATGVLSRPALEQALRSNIPAGTEQINLRALEEGWAQGAAAADAQGVGESGSG